MGENHRKTCLVYKKPVSSLVLITVSSHNIYTFIAIALDETSILVAVYFSIQNIYQSCDLVCEAEQRRRQLITHFVYWRLRDVGHVSPWR